MKGEKKKERLKEGKESKNGFLDGGQWQWKIGGKVLLAYKVFNHTLEVVN